MQLVLSRLLPQPLHCALGLLVASCKPLLLTDGCKAFVLEDVFKLPFGWASVVLFELLFDSFGIGIIPELAAARSD